MAQLEVSYAEAFELLGEVSVASLREFEADLEQQRGQRIAFSTEHVSVIDTRGDPALRSLHFNHRMNLIQSCVRLLPDGSPDHSAPPPMTGSTGTHLQGLALGVLLHHALRGSLPAQLCVLGGGGCTLPAFLHHAVPGLQATVVEASPDVCIAARECFGVGPLEAGGRFQLVQGMGEAWVAAAAPESVDVLIVDLEDGQGTPELRAPPSALLHAASLRGMCRAVAPGGVIALNFLGDEQGLQQVLAQLETGLARRVESCEAPWKGEDGVRHCVLLCYEGDAVELGTLRESIRVLPEMLEHSERWLAGLEAHAAGHQGDIP